MKIKARPAALMERKLNTVALDRIVGNVNRSLMGWVNYSHHRNFNLPLGKVKVHAERRRRKHLTKRHKVKERGIGESRLPSVKFYRRRGLYKVPTAASWKSAHALA